MFVISRRFGQSVVIGEEVLCSIVGICGNQVRLGFEAPKEISIYRKELRTERTQKEMDEELIALLTQKFKTHSNAA